MDTPLFQILRHLDAGNLHYRISRHRDDSIMITVTLVGERIEIDYFADGHIEFSRFLGDESVEGGLRGSPSLFEPDRRMKRLEEFAISQQPKEQGQVEQTTEAD